MANPCGINRDNQSRFATSDNCGKVCGHHYCFFFFFENILFPFLNSQFSILNSQFMVPFLLLSNIISFSLLHPLFFLSSLSLSLSLSLFYVALSVTLASHLLFIFILFYCPSLIFHLASSSSFSLLFYLHSSFSPTIRSTAFL